MKILRPILLVIAFFIGWKLADPLFEGRIPLEHRMMSKWDGQKLILTTSDDTIICMDKICHTTKVWKDR